MGMLSDSTRESEGGFFRMQSLRNADATNTLGGFTCIGLEVGLSAVEGRQEERHNKAK